MRRPQGGTFLKLQFYFPDRSSRGAFRHLVEALVGQGAALAGQGGIHRGPGVRDTPFRSRTDDYLVSVPLSALSELELLDADPDVRLVEVGVLKAVSAEPDLMELVTFASVSEEAARRDEHPLALLTAGWMYEGVTQTDVNNTRVAQVVG
ncbi:MAG: hypothetical protein IT340_09865 [Chloroflexi bacterium]|nr:hypothetical protein [Chloroflexota bacterium]